MMGVACRLSIDDSAVFALLFREHHHRVWISAGW